MEVGQFNLYSFPHTKTIQRWGIVGGHSLRKLERKWWKWKWLYCLVQPGAERTMRERKRGTTWKEEGGSKTVEMKQNRSAWTSFCWQKIWRGDLNQAFDQRKDGEDKWDGQGRKIKRKKYESKCLVLIKQCFVKLYLSVFVGLPHQSKKNMIHPQRMRPAGQFSWVIVASPSPLSKDITFLPWILIKSYISRYFLDLKESATNAQLTYRFHQPAIYYWAYQSFSSQQYTAWEMAFVCVCVIEGDWLPLNRQSVLLSCRLHSDKWLLGMILLATGRGDMHRGMFDSVLSFSLFNMLMAFLPFMFFFFSFTLLSVSRLLYS